MRSVTSWYIIRKGAFIHVVTTTWHYKIVEQFKRAFSYEISFFVQVKDNFQCTHQTKRSVFVCPIFMSSRSRGYSRGHSRGRSFSPVHMPEDNQISFQSECFWELLKHHGEYASRANDHHHRLWNAFQDFMKRYWI